MSHVTLEVGRGKLLEFEVSPTTVWNLFEVNKKSLDTCCSNFFVAHVEQVDEGLSEQVEIIEFKAEYKREAESGRQSVWNIGATPISTYSASFFGRLCL